MHILLVRLMLGYRLCVIDQVECILLPPSSPAHYTRLMNSQSQPCNQIFT